MADDALRYDRMVEGALRGVVRQALEVAATTGLPGNHHFYVTFRTPTAGVELSDTLRERYPNEMTIVLQHQYWDLKVDEDGFRVTLSFDNQPYDIVVPFAALAAFVDPAVKFGLQFNVASDGEASDGEPAEANPEEPGGASSFEVVDQDATDGAPTADVVTLDSFRKK